MCLHAAYTFAIGFTIEEQAVLSPKGERDCRYALSAREARVDPRKCLLIGSAGAAFFEDYDRRYEASLRLVISGLASEQRKPARRRKRIS
jgi:TetR/AcrR family transcriptional regulator, tetracycline repressor protein